MDVEENKLVKDLATASCCSWEVTALPKNLYKKIAIMLKEIISFYSQKYSLLVYTTLLIVEGETESGFAPADAQKRVMPTIQKGNEEFSGRVKIQRFGRRLLLIGP